MNSPKGVQETYFNYFACEFRFQITIYTVDYLYLQVDLKIFVGEKMEVFYFMIILHADFWI